MKIEKLLDLVYVAICVYFLIGFFVTGKEIALVVSMWSGAMLEIRARHTINIAMFTKEGENDDDGERKDRGK